MDVFLSYASEERALAERVCRVLETEGHDVFFDRDDLGGGDAFGERIRNAIAGADVLVYLISRASVAPRSYALTELTIAGALSKRRRPALLPVRTDDTPIDAVPAALRAYTILEPQGDVPAEIAHAVDRLRAQRRQRRIVTGVAAGVAAVVVAGVVALLVPPDGSTPGTSSSGPRVAASPSPDAAAVPATPSAQPPAPESAASNAAARPPVAETMAAPAGTPDPIEALNDAILRRTPPERHVTVTGMPGADGWSAVLILADRTASKISYRLDGDSRFTDTGTTGIPNVMTGEPMPNTTVQITGDFWKRRRIGVKYRDAKGVEHGEYQVDFDPRAQFLRFSKQALATVAWVSFQMQPSGETAAYFTTLLSFKPAFTRIRYSFDGAALDQAWPFTVNRAERWPPRMGDEPLFITVPPAAKFITVGLTFVDGSTETRRFDVTR